MDPALRRRIDLDLALEPSLPDGIVRDTSVHDWQRLLDLVQRKGWRAEWSGGGGWSVPPSAVEMFAVEERHALKVWPVTELQVNLFPFGQNSIDFDLDSRQLVGQGLDDCVDFVRELGQSIGKVVELSHEGDGSLVFLRYDPDADELTSGAEP